MAATLRRWGASEALAFVRYYDRLVQQRAANKATAAEEEATAEPATVTD